MARRPTSIAMVPAGPLRPVLLLRPCPSVVSAVCFVRKPMEATMGNDSPLGSYPIILATCPIWPHETAEAASACASRRVVPGRPLRPAGAQTRIRTHFRADTRPSPLLRELDQGAPTRPPGPQGRVDIVKAARHALRPAKAKFAAIKQPATWPGFGNDATPGRSSYAKSGKRRLVGQTDHYTEEMYVARAADAICFPRCANGSQARPHSETTSAGAGPDFRSA